MGVNSEQLGGAHDPLPGTFRSVSTELNAEGMRYAQKRKVSTTRKCCEMWPVAVKSATFEIWFASPGPTTVVWRVRPRELRPLKNSLTGAVISALLYAYDAFNSSREKALCKLTRSVGMDVRMRSARL